MELTRRQFNGLALSTLVGIFTGCKPNQPKTPTVAVPEVIPKFAFLNRDRSELEALLKSKQPKEHVGRSHFYSREKVTQADGYAMEEVARNFPGAKIEEVYCATYGYPDGNVGFAKSYLDYAKELIDFADVAVASDVDVPIEFLLSGQTRSQHGKVPLYVDWFRIENYDVMIRHPTRGRGGLSTSEVVFGGVTMGAYRFEGNIGERMEVKCDNPVISICSGTFEKEILLCQPLSEYFALTLGSGIQKHFAALQEACGGIIPEDKIVSAADQVLVVTEAMSEALTQHVLLRYVAQEGVKNLLPPDISNQIKTAGNYVMNVDRRYSAVPAAFRWMEQEGIDVAVVMYLNDSFGCVEKIKEYHKK